MKRYFIIFSILFSAITTMMAQKHFVYLTTSEVQIDSVLPHVGYRFNLPSNYRDSVYTVTLEYPEYIDMSPSDIKQYNHLSGAALPEIPQPSHSIVFDKKKPALGISVMPLAFRDGKYKWVSSFMLKIESKPVSGPRKAQQKDSSIYAEHSILATGKWAKIRVSNSGVHELTESVVRQAGFNNINKVKIYGYGGNLQPEKLDIDYLQETDDLHEVSQCIVNGKHLFYAKGPVSWESNDATQRIRNNYSNYGYYLITQSEESPLTVDEATFKAMYGATAYEQYHSLYEKDGHAYIHGGRNLYDTNTIELGTSKSYTLEGVENSKQNSLHIVISAEIASNAQIAFNDSVVGTIKTTNSANDVAGVSAKTFSVKGIKASNKVTINATTGGALRLDYISLTFSTPRDGFNLADSYPAAEYVHNITNQDRHGDPLADMVIIIPTSQKWLSQAQRLANFHSEHDGLTTNIVPADELYNEFSSGTPDANAYRRYMKMLYDRAETEEEAPKYLLLFGDCVWDNRLLSSSVQRLDPNDYLLSYESENSVNNITNYTTDLWFGVLDFGEGSDLLASDYVDIAIGRFPVSNASDAKIVVDKTINYMTNANAGAWQNEIMFLGDDGNDNLHMRDINTAADTTKDQHPGYYIKKVMWDQYERVSSANGHTYPEVTSIIKQQQQSGALIIDYAGHGSPYQMSHENVLMRKDFEDFTNQNLSLWVTASCDIMPFDSGLANIGESALLNSKGGTVAFFGTTRTVYATFNKKINLAFLDYVLRNDNGAVNSVGEAHRLANNYLISNGGDRTENKLKYSLCGDPALKLNLPKTTIVVDEINGEPCTSSTLPQIKAGSKVSISGHIENAANFNGTITAVMRDSKEEITCRLNNTEKDLGASQPFVFEDYQKTLYSGTSNVQDGKFSINFIMPMDINYSDKTGILNLHATDPTTKITAHGCSEHFTIGGTAEVSNDGVGPSIYCYLNSPSFKNGDNVNSTPYFVAQLNDEDGINVTGTGIGHDLMLSIDNNPQLTFNLNENFTYDFGSFTSGSTFYSLPELTPGSHTLTFRAWDIFNNSSIAELSFNVVGALTPTISNVSCTENPASTTTTFIVNHDRMGSNANIIIEVMDMSGRVLWQSVENGVTSGGAYTKTWDLTQASGQELQTGVYIYRARISSEGSEYDSKAKKLIVVR